MKENKIEIPVKVYAYEELSEANRQLIDKAKEMTYHSYAPYSHFSVGAAALLANGEIVCGSNQENAAYPSGICAERTTLFYANSQYPDVAVKALGLSSGDAGKSMAWRHTYAHLALWHPGYLCAGKGRRFAPPMLYC